MTPPPEINSFKRLVNLPPPLPPALLDVPTVSVCVHTQQLNSPAQHCMLLISGSLKLTARGGQPRDSIGQLHIAAKVSVRQLHAAAQWCKLLYTTIMEASGPWGCTSLQQQQQRYKDP